MSNVIRELLNAGAVTLLADYRGLSCRDLGPLARHGTIAGTDVRFSPLGAHFTGTGRIVHPDHVAGRNTVGSIVMLWLSGIYGKNGQEIFCASDGGGNRIEILNSTTTGITIWANGAATSATSSLLDKKCIGVNYSSGSKADLYLDGTFKVQTAGTLTVPANDAPISIGNWYGGSTYVCDFPIAAVLETNVQLTPDQHSKIYAELQAQVFPQRPYCVVLPNSLVTHNRRGLVGQWDPGATQAGICPDTSDSGATGTVTGTGSLWVEDSPLGKVARIDGARSIDCGAFAAAKGVAALTISAWLKRTAVTTGGAGVGNYNNNLNRTGLGMFAGAIYWQVSNAGAQTTNYPCNDTLWHHVVLRFDGTQLTDATRLRGWVDGEEKTLSYAGAVPATTHALAGNWTLVVQQGLLALGSCGPCAVWNRALDPAEIIQEYRRARPAGFKSDWGVPVSSAARGGVIGTELETTGWRFSDTTGRWFVDTSTVDGRPVKTLRCSTGGANVALYRDAKSTGQSAADAAYGTWEATLMIPVASGINWHFITTIPLLLAGAGGNQGYTVQASAAGSIALYRMNNGVIISTIKESAAGFLSVSVPYRLRITRDFLGRWTAKVRGGVYSAWTEIPDTGAGPFVNPDNTYTVSNYQVLGALTGLVVSLGDLAGAESINKFMTV